MTAKIGQGLLRSRAPGTESTPEMCDKTTSHSGIVGRCVDFHVYFNKGVVSLDTSLIHTRPSIFVRMPYRFSSGFNCSDGLLLEEPKCNC